MQKQKNQLKKKPPFHPLRHWLAFLLPIAVVMGCGLGLFRKAIIHSITSTPHPELVYTILSVFFIGVLLAAVSLSRYTREGNIAALWLISDQSTREKIFLTRAHRFYMYPLFVLLHDQRLWSSDAHQTKIREEIATIQSRLEDRLTLPHYLAGALVGLGLVGTFVGLLGTLDDLGKLFGALANTDTQVNADPTDLFADMVRRLQDPMRGMGTAFVASLYGLLGSLVLGLQILTVGKVGHGLGNLMHHLGRQTASNANTISAEKTPTLGNDSHHDQVRLFKELAHDLRLQQLASIKEAQALRRDIQSSVEATNALVLAVRQSIASEDRYRSSVPKTTYWQDAWLKVQAYLQRTHTDQHLSSLTETSRVQTKTLADIVIALQSIDLRLRTHLNTQQTRKQTD